MYNLFDGEEDVYGDGVFGEFFFVRDDFDFVYLFDEDFWDDGVEDVGLMSMFIEFVYFLIVYVMSIEKS